MKPEIIFMLPWHNPQMTEYTHSRMGLPSIKRQSCSQAVAN